MDAFRNFAHASYSRKGKFYHCKECEKKDREGVAQAKKNAPPKPDICQCCKKPTTKFHMDHDHDTNKFRGWLCLNCNQGIGKLGDNLEGVMNAVRYFYETTN